MPDIESAHNFASEVNEKYIGGRKVYTARKIFLSSLIQRPTVDQVRKLDELPHDFFLGLIYCNDDCIYLFVCLVCSDWFGRRSSGVASGHHLTSPRRCGYPDRHRETVGDQLTAIHVRNMKLRSANRTCSKTTVLHRIICQFTKLQLMFLKFSQCGT